MLVENDEVLNKVSDISEIFNNYFVTVTKDLGIFDWADNSSDCLNIFAQIYGFSNHPSVQVIKDNYQNYFSLRFESVSTDQVIEFIDLIDCNKNSSGDIPAEIIKIAKQEVTEPITICINNSISTDTFPYELKIADIVPVFKIEDENEKSNYRPINLLPLISKFRKGYFAQRALLNLLENLLNLWL